MYIYIYIYIYIHMFLLRRSAFWADAGTVNFQTKNL